tara:strand:- start:642 stop:1610 length:969 start_codon:yes stop_codon:yes gene_type:complete
MSSQKRVLLVDALNSYYRSYIVDPSISENGNPIGGIKGFLKILQKLVRDTSPDEVVIIWDGPGGSSRRKSVNKNYKEGRKPIKLNRSINNLTENEELENKIWQQSRLIEYLNEMPVIQIMVSNLEADDVIAYCKAAKKYDGWQKVIVSSDKDFIQLLDDETVLYRPTQKQVLNKMRVVEEYGIHPNNFALARAMAGDKNDNLPGVGGVGLLTVKKRFPFLSEEKPIRISEILEYCKEIDSNIKAYKNVVDGEKTLKENYKLMQLYSPNISVQVKTKIRDTIENPDVSYNKTEVVKMMAIDGFGEFNWSELGQYFNKVMLDNK